MTDYIELLSALYDRFSFFIYGIFCGYVIHFFEGEKMNKRNIQKIFIFGFLSVFSNSVTKYYFKSSSKDELLVMTMTIACTIYFVGLYVFKAENKEKIGAFLIKFLAKKTGLEIENKKNHKKVIIPNNKKDGDKKIGPE